VPATRLTFAPLDVQRTFAMHRLGMGDPTATLEAHRLVKTFHAGEGAVRLCVTREADEVAVEAEGTGAGAVLDAWTALLPPDDGHATFAPEHPAVRRLHRGSPGLRIVAVPWRHDVACAAILQQRVTLQDARLAWKRIALAHGGRSTLGVAFPPAARVAELPGWELERLGVDPKRGRALVALAREEARRPFLAGADRRAVEDRLLSIRGVGPWTAGMILGFGAGDPDAVLAGDLHAPRLVCWALAGEARGDDARMLELLEPFRGQRFRVTRLVLGAPSPARAG
jgi:3-methyladenine DNA glycosylase/8-oxoguanine DNA glycosylase